MKLRPKVIKVLKRYNDNVDEIGLALHWRNPFRLNTKDKIQLKRWISNYNKLFINF